MYLNFSLPARLKGKNKDILFNGHLDTVPVGDYGLLTLSLVSYAMDGYTVDWASNMKNVIVSVMVAAEPIIENNLSARI